MPDWFKKSKDEKTEEKTARERAYQEAENEKERAKSDKLFQDLLFGKTELKESACGTCDYPVPIEGKEGEYKNPCRMGLDASKNTKTCEKCSDSRYHPKK